jgi:ATP-binding cassette, subfamily B, bacterial
VRPAPVSQRHYTSLALYRRLVRYTLPYWLHVIGVFLLTLLATPLALLTPLPLKLAADSVVGEAPLPSFLDAIVPDALARSPEALIALVAGLVLAITVGTILQQLGAQLLTTYTGERIVLRFRAELFRHAQRLSLAYHDVAGTADTAYRIQHDAPAIQTLMLRGLIPLASAVLTLIGMLYITLRINPKLALVALAVAPLFLWLTRVFSLRLRKQWRRAKEIESASLAVVQEVLSALRVVKSFRREEFEQGRFTAHSDRSLTARLRATLDESLYGLSVGVITAAGVAAVLFIGLHDVRRGTLTLGNLLLIVGYVSQLYGPLKMVGKELGGGRQRALASAERALALLDERPEVVEEPDARPLHRARGRVTFEGVCFSYDGQRPALQDVTFDVAPGATVGIQGRTGAGKSTLMNLLIRFYDPTAGRVLLDGVDLRHYRLADLRDQFAIVLQEPLLFSSTIAENIAYGRPGATHDEIVAAARAARAHDFISRLPDGYQTQVGERGARLSGGERQRISVARAFLKDAPIIILDEPTSSVDANTEAAVMEALAELARGRTTFTITHRPAALSRCDLMLTVDDGRVRFGRPAAAGVHAPLATARG